MKSSAFAGKLHQTIIVCASCALAALAGPAQADTNLYVATNGSDSNDGTNNPVATLTKAVALATAGDTIYMHGGTYAVSSQINMAKAGSSSSRFTVTNYPGEVPTLNCSGESGSSEGIRITGSYWQLYGLVITNAAHNGINIRANGTLTGSFNRIERCVLAGCRNSGLLIGSSSISGSYLPGTNLVVNCDAIRNYDSPAGGNADGFSAKWNVGAGNSFVGCRSWENSDDGWDLWMATNAVVIADCWTFRNGSNVWGTSTLTFAGNGNGFKLGGNYIAANHTLVRGLAYQNVNNGSGGNGVDQNNNTGNLTVDHVTSWANSGAANFALNHNNGHGNQSHLVRNNISMGGGSSSDDFTGNTTELSNSWNNGGITVVSNDFVSMDTSQLIASRQADGSLPVITLVHPVPCGRLVDKGYIIPGYSYNGCAPDLGAYETTNACPPVAAFTGTPTNGPGPLAVTFTDTSTGCITNRYWSFGDGATSNTTATTINHTYNAGTYTVSLIVSDSVGGSGTNTTTGYIVVTGGATPPTITQQPQSTNVCAGATAKFSVTATGAAPLSYQWQTNSINLSNGGDYSGVTSNVLTVSPASATDAATYRCIVTNAAGSATSSNATLTVNALPIQYSVGGGGSYCAGGSGVTVTLSDSDPGVTYYLQLGGVNTGATLAGTGSGLNFAGVTAAGTYGILASNNTTSCTQLMSGTVTVTVNPLPTQYTVGGGGSYCSGGSGVTVTLSGSQVGVTYYLQLGGVNTGATLAGTGSALSFTGITVAGTYGILAGNDTTSCTRLMTGTVMVAVNPRPTSAVSGSATICNGSATTIQASLTGTGPWNLAWSDGTNQNGVASSPAQRSVSPSSTTTYTVTALSDAYCTAQAGDRTGSAVVTVNPRPTSVVSGDATICNGCSTIIQAALTGTGPWNLTWSDGANQNGVASSPAQRSVSPSVTTTYTVTALSDANCTAQAGDRTGSAVVTVLGAVDPYTSWASNYFGCVDCPQAAPDADPLGKGMSNTNQFLAGLNPTNPASVFRITAAATDSSNNVLITWSTAGVRTNAVQATAGDANGGYSTNGFQDLSGATFIINVSGDTTTNCVDVGGATNVPARYYRIRLVP